MRTTVSSHEKYYSSAAAEVGCFRSGDNELSYSCAIPPNTGRPGVIFVHAADGNRLGPHRMFVEMARRFNRLGYATLRFDLRGCGDSTGGASDGDIAAEVADLREAIQFLTAKTGLKEVILLGISRGAFVCHTAMVQHDLPLGGMILLSAPISSGRTALKSFGGRLREYFCKLRDPKLLWKLVSGRANVRQIWRTLATALKLGRRYKPPEKKGLASRCPILLVYGGKDHIRAESSQYYEAKYQQNGLPCDCRLVPGANHSFFHYKWKDQVCSMAQQWLERIRNGTSR